MRFDRSITIALALFAPVSASARTVATVGPAGDYATIQAAIDASESGDRLVVEAGSYTECLTLPAGVLELVGAGSATTTLDCGGTATRAVTGVDATLRLEGFTVANAGGYGISLTTGLFVGSDLVFDSLGANTTGTLGGAVFLDATDAQLKDVQFTSCAAESGGAVAQVNGGELIITNGAFSQNAADNGGAIYLNRSRFAMHLGSFTSNTAAVDGGAIFAESDSWLDVDPTGETAALAYLEGVQLTGNSAGARGGHIAGIGEGMYVVGSIDSDFESGTAGTLGGAIFTDGQGVDLDTSTLSQNRAASGGAIYADVSSLDLNRVELTSNVAVSGSGGAVYVEGTAAERRGVLAGVNLAGVVAASNTATSGQGGAVRVEGALNLQGSTLRDNEAIDGAAVWLQGRANQAANGRIDASTFEANVATGEGGALHVMGTARAQIWDSSFVSNEALFGGAVRLLEPTTEVSSSTIDRSTWSGNSATDGGAVAVSMRALTVSDSHFDANSVSSAGGALAGEGAEITLLRTFFDENVATDGGGLFVDLNSFVTVDASVFSGNVATAGGAMASLSSEIDAEHTWFCENGASTHGSVLSAVDMRGFHTFASSGFAGNTGGASVLYAHGADSTDSGAPLTVNTSSFAENVASGGTLVIDAAVTTVPAAYGASYQNYFADGAGAQVSLDTATNQWLSTEDLFQDYSPEVSPGTVDVSSFVLDGMDPLFPSWTTAAGCAGDLTPDPVYTTTPYAVRTDSADALFSDSDSDGFTAAEGDCNPDNGAVFPGATEIDGDGIDQNCDGLDGQDYDGDGVEDAVDCRYSDATVPGAEVWYDGDDSDCNGVSDWDQDLDRFEVFVVGDHEESSAPFLLRMADCDDTDGDIFPGAPETWYDGVDSDCDALNDFDQDFDGYVATAHNGEVGGSAVSTDDCDDLRGDVYPGAEDAWYDGLDADCAGNNDFDQDGDGYVAIGYEDGVGSLLTGDCDDLVATVNPGATDTVGNEIDDDCDGRVDVDITTDTDRDGVPDLYEEQYGTDPFDPDSDGDGIYDGKEWHDSCDTYTFADDPPVDTDGDSIIDALDLDSDGDGLSDTQDGLADIDDDCLENYRDTDNDGDGVSTADEVEAGTDPDNPDTDGDGLLDGDDPDPLVDESDIVDTGPVDPPVEEDCGCSSSGSSSMGLFFLPLLALLRRRA
ncbi:MAG: hypothetical protein KC912_08580 [Proteobacteria bacterium]|nr:hypothetical protein [Pseudomonadota bacterium]